MRAFIYCRFSSHKQQELSIEGQLAVCREYAAKHGITICGEYADRARSGRTENRADFRRLIRDAMAGGVDLVLSWRYDRFFRNRAESALFRKQLEDAGVRFISVTEYIPEGSAGIITQGMIETVAEYFSAKLSEDVQRGMQKAAEHCQITGRAPLGYQAGPNKRWQINPVEAEIVHRAFEWYASGQPMRQLVDQLNREGYCTRSGAPFRVSSFKDALSNEKYIGIYTYGDTVRIAGGCPRIIEDDLFFQVQRRLHANRHRPGAYKAGVPYLLSGKLFCGLCGAPMVGMTGTSHTGGRHYYYACSNHRARRCPKKNVRLDAIETAVLNSALDALTPESIANISAEVAKRSATESESAALLDSLNAQLADVQRQLKNIGQAIAQGIITETTKQMLLDHEADRAALLAQIDRAKVQASLVVRAEDIACWLDGFRRGDRGDPGFRRQVFNALIHSVYLYDDHLRIVYNVDSAGAVIVPFSAVQDANPAPAAGMPAGSYLKGKGSPRRRKRHIACGGFFVKTTARSFCCGSFSPRNFALQTFAGAPRPCGPLKWTALHSKSPVERPGFSHTASSFLLFPTGLCYANPRGGPAGRFRKRHIACGGFLSKPPRAYSAAAPFPHETLLCKFSQGPRGPAGRLLQANPNLVPVGGGFGFVIYTGRPDRL